MHVFLSCKMDSKTWGFFHVLEQQIGITEVKEREKAQCLKAHTIILQKNRIQFLVPTMDGSQECMTPVLGDLKPSTMACTCTQMHRHAHNHNLNLYQKKKVLVIEKGKGWRANSGHWVIKRNHWHRHWNQSDKQCTKNLVDCVTATNILLFCPNVKPVCHCKGQANVYPFC